MKWIIVLSDGETWEELSVRATLELYSDEDFEKLRSGMTPRDLKPDYTHRIYPPHEAPKG